MWFVQLCVVVATLLAGTGIVVGQADNIGREFIVVFLRNEVNVDQHSNVELFITTHVTLPVQVLITVPKYSTAQPINIRTTVVSGQVERVVLPHELRLDWIGRENKVIYIQADGDIVVYGLNKELYSTDGFLVLPTDVIGYEYYTMSHTPTSSYTSFAVAAKFDNTQVSITFPAVSDNRDIPLRVDYFGSRYTHGDQLNFTLNAFEAFQVLPYDLSDLTGSYIVSSLPVAVFSGNARTWVGRQSSRDHLVVQLPPVQAYGTIFPIVPTPRRTVGDRVRVVSSQPNTRVTVNNGGNTQAYDIENLSNYVDFLVPSDSMSLVSTDKPSLVVQIAQSQVDPAEPGDPTMFVVTSEGQLMSDYVFSTPVRSSGDSYVSWFVCIVQEDEQNGLMYDNQPISSLNPQWSSIPGTGFTGAQMMISEGAHAIRHASPVVRFGGYVVGTADRESYSFQIGTRLAPINQPCVPTESTFGDGVDNDCDGRIDEELCLGVHIKLDTDGDGTINEDCAINRDIAAGAPDSGGTQFVVFFMENQVESPRYLPLELYVTPLRAASATVQVESPLWFEPSVYLRDTVKFGEVKTFYVPYTMRETGTGMTSKALFITSDQDISVYAVNKELYSADAFLALPIDTLGKVYYTVTHWPNSDTSQCQIGVIGIHDGSLVDIEFPSTKQRGDISVEYGGVTFTNGETLSIVINRFSTLQLQSRGDLSGTKIRSTQKIAVMSGNIRTAVGSGSSRDHLVAMLPPVESWGRLYITSPIPARSVGDYFYILASENDTTVEMVTKETFSLNAGERRQVILSSLERVAIQSDKPILVAQLSQSQQSANEVGDPTMIVLPSVEQWANAYTFSTATPTAAVGSDTAYQNFITLTAHEDDVDGILVDEKTIPPLFTTWYPAYGTNYTSTSFEISEGAHTVQHIDPTVTVEVIVYGNADKESYGFPAGMRLARINTPCDTTVSQPGDGIDNDCDGRIDEEICEGPDANRDDDGDQKINEDCSAYFPTTLPPSSTTPSGLSTTTTTPASTRPPWMIAGPPGAIGPQGPVGPPGPQGVPGYNGFPGSPGQDGTDGLNGAKGGQGATGATGATGPAGATGARGLQGQIGVTGIQGPGGAVGATGMRGDKGDPGLSIKGDIGATGSTGSTGATGRVGEFGATGATGAKGVMGPTGPAGVTGPKGDKGFQGEIGPAYQDVNECEEDRTICSYECVNTIGSYYCTCPTGYKLTTDNYYCSDINECEIYNGGCVERCINREGSHYCQCTTPGYHMAADNKTCVDTDECARGDDDCTENQMCINTVGSYRCATMSVQVEIVTPAPDPCPSGQQLDSGENCVDIDECQTSNGGCTHECRNIANNFYCSCPSGLRLAQDSRSCVDSDECEQGADNCDDTTEVCTNTYGGFFCQSRDPGSSVLASSAAVVSDSGMSIDTSGLIHGDVILSLLAWLIVITVLIIVLIVLVCRQAHDLQKFNDKYMEQLRSIYHDQQQPTVNPRISYNSRHTGYKGTDMDDQDHGSSVSAADSRSHV